MAIQRPFNSTLYQPSTSPEQSAHPAPPNRQPCRAVWRCPAPSAWFRA